MQTEKNWLALVKEWLGIWGKRGDDLISLEVTSTSPSPKDTRVSLNKNDITAGVKKITFIADAESTNKVLIEFVPGEVTIKSPIKKDSVKMR